MAPAHGTTLHCPQAALPCWKACPLTPSIPCTHQRRHDNPWWLSRPAVLAVALCGVVAPMLVPRSLAAVARFSRFSVACVLGLAATICGLAATATVQGRLAPDVRLLPDPATMGGGTPLGIATSLLTVVSGERRWDGRRFEPLLRCGLAALARNGCAAAAALLAPWLAATLQSLPGALPTVQPAPRSQLPGIHMPF